jgi:hypothetical protein
LLHVDGCFSLSRSTEKLLALDAGRGAFRLFSQALRLIGQALIQGRGLFYATSFLHGATPHTRRRERGERSHHRWQPRDGAVMTELRPPLDGSQSTSAHRIPAVASGMPSCFLMFLPSPFTGEIAGL